MSKLSGAVIAAMNSEQRRDVLFVIDSFVECSNEGYFLTPEQWEDVLAGVLE